MCLVIDGSYHLIPFDRNPPYISSHLIISIWLICDHVSGPGQPDRLPEYASCTNCKKAINQSDLLLSCRKMKQLETKSCSIYFLSRLGGDRSVGVEVGPSCIYSSTATNLISKGGGSPDPGPDLSFLCVPLSSHLCFPLPHPISPLKTFHSFSYPASHNSRCFSTPDFLHFSSGTLSFSLLPFLFLQKKEFK